MKNVTITLEEETAQWARIWAARRGTSVSRLLGEMLKERMLRDLGYDLAKKRFMSRKPTKLKSSGEPYPSRDALHER